MIHQCVETKNLCYLGLRAVSSSLGLKLLRQRREDKETTTMAPWTLCGFTSNNECGSRRPQKGSFPPSFLQGQRRLARYSSRFSLELKGTEQKEEGTFSFFVPRYDSLFGGRSYLGRSCRRGKILFFSESDGSSLRGIEATTDWTSANEDQRREGRKGRKQVRQKQQQSPFLAWLAGMAIISYRQERGQRREERQQDEKSDPDRWRGVKEARSFLKKRLFLFLFFFSGAAAIQQGQTEDIGSHAGVRSSLLFSPCGRPWPRTVGRRTTSRNRSSGRSKCTEIANVTRKHTCQHKINKREGQQARA